MADTKEIKLDIQGFCSALDSARETRKLNWKQVAGETGVAASTLTRMQQGKRPDADSLAALSAWAGINPANFVEAKFAARAADPLTMISQQIRSDTNLSPDARIMLDQMVKSAYASLLKK